LIFIKTGLQIKSLEGIGQNIACGFLFIVLQFKEYIFAYFTISDTFYGSIFYFTTGLHGFHVFFGSIGFLILLDLQFYKEFHQSLQL
jgi:heme/copper-type cytochrome/quinol oxidase subunit 3